MFVDAEPPFRGHTRQGGGAFIRGWQHNKKAATWCLVVTKSRCPCPCRCCCYVIYAARLSRGNDKKTYEYKICPPSHTGPITRAGYRQSYETCGLLKEGGSLATGTRKHGKRASQTPCLPSLQVPLRCLPTSKPTSLLSECASTSLLATPSVMLQPLSLLQQVVCCPDGHPLCPCEPTMKTKKGPQSGGAFSLVVSPSAAVAAATSGAQVLKPALGLG